jgi:E1A/CREB-binding protein
VTAAGPGNVALRTYVYHQILLGYLDFVKRLGFEHLYIWACPPLQVRAARRSAARLPAASAAARPCCSRLSTALTLPAPRTLNPPPHHPTTATHPQGDDYILYCHPSRQKTPRSDRLRAWYHDMLRTAKAEGIVCHLSTLWDTYFEGGRDHRVDKCSAVHIPYLEGARPPGWAAGAAAAGAAAAGAAAAAGLSLLGAGIDGCGWARLLLRLLPPAPRPAHARSRPAHHHRRRRPRPPRPPQATTGPARRRTC